MGHRSQQLCLKLINSISGNDLGLVNVSIMQHTTELIAVLPSVILQMLRPPRDSPLCTSFASQGMPCMHPSLQFVVKHGRNFYLPAQHPALPLPEVFGVLSVGHSQCALALLLALAE